MRVIEGKAWEAHFLKQQRRRLFVAGAHKWFSQRIASKLRRSMSVTATSESTPSRVDQRATRTLSSSSCFEARIAPNASIEWTSSGLRPPAAAHVKRQSADN